MTTILGTIETGIEAADSRFFVDSEPAFYDFQELQQDIGELAKRIRTGSEAASLWMGGLQAKLHQLERALHAEEGSGWLVMALPLNRFLCEQFAPVIAEYQVETADPDTVLLVVPRDSITAQHINPRIYGEGTAVSPVLDLRIDTSTDEPTTYRRGMDMVENSIAGRWYSVSLEVIPLALITD